ncbi:chaplin [Streptomyces sp. CT34]|uniref:chaplin n=1 Tax=Streptomyces sp. CT34 TaxID=1553907 RepID=UPI0005B84A47|nr:chaplin [Streptomyces sp. CT34]
MRRVARKGLITMAAAGGVLAMATGYAQADSGAVGTAANSPGVGSGNVVQAPVEAPVNVCGNTVNVVGMLNPAFGNHCANGAGGHHGHGHGKHRRPTGGHGGNARGGASNSPGVASGNVVQAPVNAPVNVCGNSVDVVGVANPAFGGDCDNAAPGGPGTPHRPGHPPTPGPGTPHNPGHPGQPHHPGRPHHPGGSHGSRPGAPQGPGAAHSPHAPGVGSQHATAPHARGVTPTEHGQQLAHTGAGALGYAVPASAGLLLGGAVLYRRARTARS